MNRRRWVVIGIGLITAAVGWWLRGWWLPWIPVWGAGLKGWTQAWGDTVQSLADGVTLLLLVLGGLAAWMGLKKQGPGQDEARRAETAGPLVQKPLNQLMEEKLAGGAAIQWVDRGATRDLDLFRHERVIIVGPSRIGKTREALELVRRAIHQDQVTRQRVYQPNYQDIRFQTGEGLTAAIGHMVDPEMAALLFVDDFPYHFQSEEARKRLAETLGALGRCKKLYVVMTGRSDQLTAEQGAWLAGQGITGTSLPGLDGEQMGAFVNYAADVAGQDVTEDGRDALVALAGGVPEVARVTLLQLGRQGRGAADAATVQAVGATTVEALWAQSRQEIEGRTPVVRYVLDALQVFHAAGISKSEAMVLAYAGALWRKGQGLVWRRRKKLGQALAGLAVYEIRVVDGLVVGPDQVMAGGPGQEEALARLTAFLRRYRWWLHNRWLRHWHRERTAQSWALYDLALERQGRGDHAGAVEAYTWGIRVHPDSWFYNRRGDARSAQGDLAGAMADYDEAIRLDPENAYVYAIRGNARSDQGNVAGAGADYDEAIRLDPEYAFLFWNRGNARYAQGDLAGAVADFDEAIRLNPEDAYFYQTRGDARYAQGDVAGAMADYDEAIRLDPEDAYAYVGRGLVRKAQGDLAGAVADYDEAIRLNPAYAHAYNNRGIVRKAQGDLAGAMADYDEAIRLNPTNAAAFFNRGNARRDQEDQAGAEADFNEVISLLEAMPNRSAEETEYLRRTQMHLAELRK